jgi:beta-hydroxyacyl-[acyl carrier protein] dehydratase FabZ
MDLDVSKILPHRYPFLLVDRIVDYEVFNYLNALKNVTLNEYFFQGHFPGNPVMPGVLMVEALAQASGLLFYLSRTAKPGHKFLSFFASIDKVKFKHIVTPGDQLRLEVKFLGSKRDFWRTHGEVFIGEKCVCSADLMNAAKEVKCDDNN